MVAGKITSSSLPNSYSTVRNYKAILKFKNGSIIHINGQQAPPDYARHSAGLLLEGENGSIWVSRREKDYQFGGSLAEEISNDKGLLERIEKRINQLYNGQVPAWRDAGVIGDIIPTSHMENFVNCVKDRTQPVSDVFTAHRSNSSALLAHSAMLLGRTLQWDPDTQKFINDDQANQLLGRKYHKPYIV